MSDGEYTPLVDREREPRSRIYEELTRPARERLSIITEPISEYGESAMSFLRKRVGKTPLQKYYWKDRGDIQNVEHENFLIDGENVHVLTYIEMIINTHHRREVVKKVFIKV